MIDKKSKKVLNIITLFSVGGATETVVSMAHGLILRGYEVHIATGPNIPTEGSMYEVTDRLNIPVFTFPKLMRKINLFNDVQIIFQLARFIKKNSYDIVHTHSSKAGVVGRIAAWLAGTPVRVHTIHGLPFHRYQTWYLRNLFKLIEMFTAMTCNKLIAVSHTIVDVMVKNKLARQNKFVVIRSGFEIKIFQNYDHDIQTIRNKYNLDKNDIIIGKVARFSILKGHMYLLSAFEIVNKKMPNVKLLLIGNGELENKLKKTISEKHLEDKVIFTGLVQPEEIPSVISLLDILVHTSLLEGLARVLPQAIMMGKPVISFDLDGAHEVIKNGLNGYLIEPENIEMLADRIIELASDLEKAKKFGQYGKDFLGDEFSEEKMVKQVHDLYMELLSTNK
ncbi:MAG: glycosyltransferase family 4 protein [Melioribacteraceae bacterium]